MQQVKGDLVEMLYQVGEVLILKGDYYIIKEPPIRLHKRHKGLPNNANIIKEEDRDV